MTSYTGYGELNDILNEFEELRVCANLRAMDLMKDDLTRTAALSSAGAYAYCIMRLTSLGTILPERSR